MSIKKEMLRERNIKVYNIVSHEQKIALLKLELNPDAKIQFISQTNNTVMIEARDFFSCLQELRKELLKSDLIVLCNGSRTDVYPSGMSRQMSNGIKALKLVIGRQARQEDILDIFDEAPLDKIGSVEEREEYYKKWLESLGN